MFVRDFDCDSTKQERDDTNEKLVDLSLPHRLLVKHDGSLVGPVLLKSGAVRFATKSGSSCARYLFTFCPFFVPFRCLSFSVSFVPLLTHVHSCFSGFGPIIEMLESRFLSLRENKIYETWSAEWLRRGYAPMFEYVSQRNKIVLVRVVVAVALCLG